MRLFTGLNVSLANTAIGVIREQGQHGVARRRVATRAMVALARRVGVILHRTWGEDTAFRSGIAGPIRPDDSRSQPFPAETQAFAVPPGRGSDEAVVRIVARNTKHASETGTSALHGTSITWQPLRWPTNVSEPQGAFCATGSGSALEETWPWTPSDAFHGQQGGGDREVSMERRTYAPRV